MDCLAEEQPDDCQDYCSKFQGSPINIAMIKVYVPAADSTVACPSLCLTD